MHHESALAGRTASPRRLSLAAGSAVLVTTTLHAQPATFQGLGHFPGATTHWSRVVAVSADGSTAVGSAPTSQGSRGFRWTAATGLSEFDNPAFYPQAVSSDGSVVVGAAGQAARWTSASGVVLQGFPASGFTRSSLLDGISADGQIACGIAAHHHVLDHCYFWDIPYDLLRTRAFVQFEPQGPLNLLEPFPEDNSSIASAVSADGSIVVGASIFQETCQGEYRGAACMWIGQGPAIRIGIHYSAATAVSADGSIIVGNFGNRAVRWTAGNGMTDLGDLSGSWNYYGPSAVSGDGSIVVGVAQRENENAAFIWDQTHGMRAVREVLTNEHGIDLTTWRLQWATGVSADGRTIVGNGVNPTGQSEAWIAFLGDPPPPCPGDVNGDSTVNLTDLATLLAHFGLPSSATYAEGDLDSDGDVDLSDLTALLANFGTTCT